MIKKLGISIALASSLASISAAQAGCIKIDQPSLSNSSTNGPWNEVAPQNCGSITTNGSIVSTLAASGQFPDIFANTTLPTLLPLCYASPTTGIPLSIKIANVQKTYYISTVSAWTNEFIPLEAGGADNLFSAITQWDVKDSNRHAVGKFYTHDTNNAILAPDTNGVIQGSELDVIVGGMGGAKGALRVYAQYDLSVSPPVAYITGITGNICLPFTSF